MSLDVYLTVDEPIAQSTEPQIFIREQGQLSQISRAEWDARFPDREPVTVQPPAETTMVYRANITHNLTDMAKAADLYVPLWHPEERGYTTAQQLIAPLATGLAQLRSDPSAYGVHAPANGWGSYQGLCDFVAAYLVACAQYPDAKVSVWV